MAQAQSILQCALDGMGIALLPEWLIGEALETGTLVPLFSEYDISSDDDSAVLWAICPSQTTMPLKSRMFIDFLTQRIK